MGITLAVNPVVLLILLVILLPVLFVVKIVSLIAITGALLYPIITYMVQEFRHQPPLFDTVFALVFSVIVIYMHRENIKRLLNGTEKRIGQKTQGEEQGNQQQTASKGEGAD